VSGGSAGDVKERAIQVAGLMNPAISSWMALRTRVKDLPKDFTVVVLGATSSSGRVAILLARSLGAGKVVGVARDAAKLAKLDLDQATVLDDEVSTTDFSAEWMSCWITSGTHRR
jgi:NADPH:quinone reductase-like Zn-dependent oxidoreductase